MQYVCENIQVLHSQENKISFNGVKYVKFDFYVRTLL